jgi:thiosulfate/3-mercaptopyruvate sulfurtransferase
MTSANSSVQQDRHQASDVLVGPHWLATHLKDPEVHVIEVDVDPAAYNQGHISGAVLWNVYRDLKDTGYRTVDRSVLTRLLERSGIDNQSTVVFYGYAPAFGFWLLKLYGHRDVRILDCSRQVWVDADLPWTAQVPTPRSTGYRLPDAEATIRAEEPAVRAAIGRTGTTILDVRADPEFRGERFWPSGGQQADGRAGHIPSAVNLSLDGILDEQGRFRSETELRAMFQPFAGTSSGVITYCTIGARASTAWLR